MQHLLMFAAVHNQGVMDALKGQPWYLHLAAAAGLGIGAYVVREIDNRRDGESMLLEIVTFILAIGALILAYQGVFGDS